MRYGFVLRPWRHVTPAPRRARRCRLASLLGGDLHVSDRLDGVRGVRFRLRVPLRVPPVATVDLAIRSPTSAAHDYQMRKEGRSTILVKRQVLVVDDAEGNRRLARRMLLQLGCRVMEVTDGDEVCGPSCVI